MNHTVKNPDILKHRGNYHVHNSLSVSIDQATIDQLLSTRMIYTMQRRNASAENRPIFNDAIDAITAELAKRETS